MHMLKRLMMTLAAMACGAALTMIIKGGDVREITGAACVSLALMIAGTLTEDIRRRATQQKRPRASSLNMESWLN